MSNFPKKNFLVYIPNNFQVWYNALVEHASHEYGVLAISLSNEKLINFDRIISNISFPISQNPLTRAEVRREAEGSAAEGDDPDVTLGLEPVPLSPMDRMVHRMTAQQVLDSTSDDPIIIQAKLMVMKARDRLYDKTPSLFAYMMATMSPQSKAVVQSHPDYRTAHIQGDVFTLFKIAKDTHMVNMEGEQLRLEQKLQEMAMGGDDFTTYAARFHDLLVGLGSAGSKISAARQVYVFLMSLRGSPLQISADRWLENPRQDGYPASFDEARNLMHMAWVSKAESLHRDVAMVARHPPHPTSSQQSSQSSSTGGSKCLFCQGSHSTDFCRLYRVERRDGQMLVVPASSERKKKTRKGGPRKNTSGLVIHGEFTNSSYIAGNVSSHPSSSRLVLDTGTTIHIFRDRDLLLSTSSCREEVHGVGGERCLVTLKGKSRWGDAYHIPSCPFNLISYRTLMDLGFEVEWGRDAVVTTSPSGDRLSFEYDDCTSRARRSLLLLMWRVSSPLSRRRGRRWSVSFMSGSIMRVTTRWHHSLTPPAFSIPL
jgi:hypothetical protein